MNLKPKRQASARQKNGYHHLMPIEAKKGRPPQATYLFPRPAIVAPNPETHLIVAILRQAVSDAYASPDDPTRGPRSGGVYAPEHTAMLLQSQARAFLYNQTGMLLELCHMLDVDMEPIQRALLRAAHLPLEAPMQYVCV